MITFCEMGGEERGDGSSQVDEWEWIGNLVCDFKWGFLFSNEE
jgi:hypothetical protein